MDCSLFGTAFENIIHGWEAKQNDRGVIYYANVSLQITSWNHPYLTKLLEEFDLIYGDIKFAAYRTSLKLRALQTRLGFSWISQSAVKQIFAARLTGNQDGGYLSCSEALAFIQNILELSHSQQGVELEVQTAADIILNLMMNLYDINRSGKVCSRSLRNALIALSSSRLSEKYKYFFISVKDENETISRESLLFLIDDLMQITDMLSESAAFGRSAASAVESCFKFAKKSERSHITQYDFNLWLTQEPQTLVWLPTLHRIVATEKVEHVVCCRVCSAMPIIGLRYRCLACFKYDLCQGCFLHSHISLAHKRSHPVKEYCFPASITDNAKAFLKIMRNKMISWNRGGARPMYLSVENSDVGTEHVQISEDLQSDVEAHDSRSTDSGLAPSSDSGDTAAAEVNFSDETYKKQKAKPMEIMGHPCNTSSPLVGDAEQELAVMTKRDMELEQKQMTRKIEQLQKENRQLQQKLRKYENRYQSEYDNSSCIADDSDTKEMFSCGDPLKEITTNSPISPIVTRTEATADKLPEQSNSNSENGGSSRYTSEADVLDIVGAYTPVRSFPVDDICANDGNRYEDNKGENKTQNTDSLQELTQPYELQYRSSDMSLHADNTIDETGTANLKTDVSGTRCEESAMSNGLVYRSSDMSLDFLDNSEEKQSSHMRNKTDDMYMCEPSTQCDPHLVNYSVNSSSHEQKKTSGINCQSFQNNENKKQRPSLIFTSASLKSRTASPAEKGGISEMSSHDDCAGKVNPFIEKYPSGTNVDDSCGELSEIFPQSKTPCLSANANHFLHSNEPTPTELKAAPRRKTIEPVHMSTPVNKSKGCHPITPKSAFVKRPRSIGSTDFDLTEFDKENKTVAPKNMSVATKLHTPTQSLSSTPLSSIPSWQRKRILMSVNSMPSNHSQSCDNVTAVGDSMAGLSVMFKKAELIGKLMGEDASMTMETQDKEELERLMQDFNRECGPDNTEATVDVGEPRQPVDDDSMLDAVLNIGNAMANFVQATAQYQ